MLRSKQRSFYFQLLSTFNKIAQLYLKKLGEFKRLNKTKRMETSMITIV